MTGEWEGNPFTAVPPITPPADCAACKAGRTHAAVVLAAWDAQHAPTLAMLDDRDRHPDLYTLTDEGAAQVRAVLAEVRRRIVAAVCPAHQEAGRQ